MTQSPNPESVDRETIERLKDELLRGELSFAADLFAARSMGPPKAVWDPAPTDVELAPLRFLLGYWHSLAPPGSLPRQEQIDALDLKPALGYLMLLDVLEEGWDYRYRVYGSEIARWARRDYTGMRTSELSVTTIIPMFYIAGYRAVADRRIPLYTENNAPPEVTTQSWRRLILPLVNADDKVSRFLVGNMPGAWRHVPPADDMD